MKTVIVAEPQALARNSWQRDFTGAGFAVFTAADEAELDGLLAQGLPDVLVADRRLVGPAGERLRRLRAAPGRCPLCVVLALLPAEDDRQALVAAGADWYVDKAALASDLSSAVKAGLDEPPPPDLVLRVAPRTLVALRVDYSQGPHRASGETLNLSDSGMFIQTPRPAAVGTLLLLGFALPGARGRECFARVAWIRRPTDADCGLPGMGVQFVALNPEARGALAAFVAEGRAALAASSA